MAYQQREPLAAPEESEFKGFPMFNIPYGKNAQPFSFGLAKAQAIVTYYNDIVEFVNKYSQGQ